MKRLHVIATLAMAACGGSVDARPGNAVPQVVSIDVFSGRPQPPPAESSVRVGVVVAVRLIGLGPPEALVIAPDGSPVETVSLPVKKDGDVVGSEQRFTPRVGGIFRVVESSSGLDLARLNAS